MDKRLVISQLRTSLQERIAVAEEAIASTRTAFASDSKSSAGDKHEVGRAMIQQELDKQEEQRAKLMVLQQELARVPLEREYDRVAFGSLVTTDQGSYFIAIGMGAVEMDDGTCYAISLASPIGQLLKDKRVGDAVTLNGKKITIKNIS